MALNVEYIAPIELFIINRVKYFRLELGILPEELSLYLNKKKNYIGNIESNAHNGKYNDTTLNQIAKYFTNKAKEIKTSSKIQYTIYDFYPTEILDDSIVIKTISNFNDGYGPTGTLNALIESTDFFKHKRVLKEIVEKANDVQNKNWKGNNFTQPLEYAVKNNRLKLEIIDGLNHYSLLKVDK